MPLGWEAQRGGAAVMPPEAFSRSSPPGLFPSAPRFRTVFVFQGSLRRIFQTGKDSPPPRIKPRPGPLRAAMLSASPSVLEVQVQTPRRLPAGSRHSKNLGRRSHRFDRNPASDPGVFARARPLRLLLPDAGAADLQDLSDLRARAGA